MCTTIGFGLKRGKQPIKSHGNDSEINNRRGNSVTRRLILLHMKAPLSADSNDTSYAFLNYFYN